MVKQKTRPGVAAKNNPKPVVKAKTKRTRRKQRSVATVNKNKFRLHGTEPLDSITGTSTFTVSKTYLLQPGSINDFPRLSKMAKLYDRYRFTKLIYHYRPGVSTFTSGIVYMAFDHNVYDEVSTTRSKLLQLNHTHGSVWEPFSYQVKLDQDIRFVRDPSQWSIYVNADKKTYDYGKLSVASESGPDAITGNIEVEYEVEFYNQNDGELTVPPETINNTSDSFEFTEGTDYTNTPVDWGSLPVVRTVYGTEGASFPRFAGQGRYWSVNTSNNQLIQCKVAGRYRVEITLTAMGNRQGYAMATLRYNNTEQMASGGSAWSEATGPNMHTIKIDATIEAVVGGNLAMTCVLSKNGATHAWSNGQTTMFVLSARPTLNDTVQKMSSIRITPMPAYL